MARITETGPTLTAPAWAGDFMGREHLVPGGARLDAAQFRATDAVEVEATANAAVDATTIAVTALTGPIPSGTILDFGAKKFAQLTADAAAGATSISVEALATQVDQNDVAWYDGVETKAVVSGTPVGRTFAERAAGDALGPAATGDDEVYLVAFDVIDADISPNVELYRPGSMVKENLLPDFANLDAAVLTLIRGAYNTQTGQV